METGRIGLETGRLTAARRRPPGTMARREPLLVRATKYMGAFLASSLIAAWLTLCVMRAVFIPTVDAKMTLFPSSGKIGKKVHPGPDVQFPMAPTPAPDDGVSWDDQTARARAAEDVRAMFHHAYDNYMTHAFPHDELKPLSRTWTDSLGELGNLDMKHLPEDYAGVALTLIDATSTLAVLGNKTEFARNVRWMERNLDFDIDVRVNAFECNIRVLAGLLSAHVIALGDGGLSTGAKRGSGSKKGSGSWFGKGRGSGSGPSSFDKDGGVGRSMGPPFMPEYTGGLLPKALDLGERLLRAFGTKTGMPYAWVNLRHGVRAGETNETNVAAVGSFILEFGMLSRLSGDRRFERAARGAIRSMWSIRGERDLLGNTLDVQRGTWVVRSGGIGAGCDSFFEYLLKAYVMFGDDEYYHMFSDAYVAAMRYYHDDGWYHEAHLNTGVATHAQATSLQAFWPGMQTLIGDVEAARATHARFASVWDKYGVFPERFMYREQHLHPTEKHYPLRPEHAESTAMLYMATRDDSFRTVGARLHADITRHTRVPGGHASVRDVSTKALEDHQHSFFLAETCKYLYLLFDDSFMDGRNVVFTTEGHPLPVLAWESREDTEVTGGASVGSWASDGKSRYNGESGSDGGGEVFDAAEEDVVVAIIEAATERMRREKDDEGRVDRTKTYGGGEYRASWSDPTAALVGEGFNGAGWGLTERVCPNLDVIGTARTVGACTPVDASRASSLTSSAPPGDGDSVEMAAKLSGLQSRLERLKEAMAAANKANSGSPQKLQEMMNEFVKSEATRAGKSVEDEKVSEKAYPTVGGNAPKPSPVRGPPVRRANVKGEDSECHVLDLKEDHRCKDDADCGVDAKSCSPRECSQHKYCFTAP